MDRRSLRVLKEELVAPLSAVVIMVFAQGLPLDLGPVGRDPSVYV